MPTTPSILEVKKSRHRLLFFRCQHRSKEMIRKGYMMTRLIFVLTMALAVVYGGMDTFVELQAHMEAIDSAARSVDF